MNPALRLAAVLCLLITPAPRLSPPLPPEARILFVGNSLTYTNNLPGMLSGLGRLAGKRIVTGMEAYPNYSLEDHLADGRAIARIERDKWDVVVLQQGPTSQPDSRLALLRDAERLSKTIGRAGSRAAVFMVWPDSGSSQRFPAVIESHRLAAEEIAGILLPAGAAWQEAFRLDGHVPLYGPDGFHPSPLGSYLAAVAIYGALYGEIPPRFADPESAAEATGGSVREAAGRLMLIRRAALTASGLAR